MNGEAWGIGDVAELNTFLEIEREARAAIDAELVRKGRLDQREADYRRKLVEDIRADLADEDRSAGWPRGGRAVAWASKVKWIDGELEERRSNDRARIAKGRLSAADSERAIAALDKLRQLYWSRLFRYEPPKGPALDYLKAMREAVLHGAPSSTRDALRRAPGRSAFYQLVRDHMKAIELEQEGEATLGI